MKRKLVGVGLIVIIALCFACAANRSYVKNSYDILSTSKTSYEMAFGIAADMYVRGLMSENDKAKIIEAGRIYKLAHDTAVESLATYAESEDPEAPAEIEKQILIVSDSLAKLLALVKPFLEEEL